MPGVTIAAPLGYAAVPPAIDPEPTEAEREAILAALAAPAAADSEWAAAALLEGVEAADVEP